MGHRETAGILRLAELLRVAVLRGQVSCWVPATSSAARALLGFTLCRFLTSAQGLAHITLSKPFRGTQQAGETGKQESQRSAKKSAKSYTRGIVLSSSTDWGLSSCRQPCREQQRAMSHHRPCSKETPQCPALHWRSMPAGWGRALLTLLSPPETLGPALGSSAQHRNGHTRVNPVKGHKGGEVTEYLTDKENLGELGLSLSPGEERAQVISPACVNAWEGAVKEEPNSSSKSRDGQEEVSTSGNNRSST